MIRNIACMLVGLVAALSSIDTAALEIDNFRAGLVCDLELELRDGRTMPVGWICVETETIQVTGQGRCIWAGEEKHCTWYGFEFDYTGATEEDEIVCKRTSTKPMTEGNPDGINKQGVTESEYTISVPPGDGHFFNPQYSLLSYFGPSGREASSETACFFEDEEVFRFRFNTIFPGVTEKTIMDSVRRTTGEPE